MSVRSSQQLRDDAIAIWKAGVDAVLGDRLVEDFVQVEGDQVWLGDDCVSLSDIDRLVVVGGGKAGASMAVGLERALALVAKRLTAKGMLNIPEGCFQPTEWIQLHEARPAGRNEPTNAGAEGTARMLDWVESLGPRDWCIVLLSGGGSALLPAPIEGVSLDDKLQTTRFLSGAGANIEQLNTVRKALSRIKGGGLARSCRAGRLDTLIISDVLGDPLDVIASGPTVPSSTGPREALLVLNEFDPDRTGISAAVYQAIETAQAQQAPGGTEPRSQGTAHIIGNLAVAVDAAGIEAERRGYSHAMDCARSMEGSAESVGVHHAQLAMRMKTQPGPDCLITGGEPTVQLAPPDKRGVGGRNQQLVLAALQELQRLHALAPGGSPTATEGICVLSGGTDGEDGPTDAAGGWIEAEVEQTIEREHLDLARALERNDAYPLLQRCNSLLRTGPTHTNVCDLRVVVVDRIETTAADS